MKKIPAHCWEKNVNSKRKDKQKALDVETFFRVTSESVTVLCLSLLRVEF